MSDQQMMLLDLKDEDADIPKSYTGIYSMHKYWSKKPYNIVRQFILKYSDENDIVLDPFAGSGISITESVFSNRKAFGIDINPSAIFITRQMLEKFSIRELREEFKRLENICKDKINCFYCVKRDNKAYTGTHFLWDNGNLVELWYTDGKSKIIDTPNDEDIGLVNSFKYDEIPYHYPKRNFFHNPRINAYRDCKMYELFTPRNLMALSLLLNEINKIENQKLKDLFRFCFTASVGQASKMVFVVSKRGKTKDNFADIGRKEVGSWVIGYWIPKESFEINVWNCFENRWRRIIKAKNEQLEVNYKFNEAVNFPELLDTNCNVLLLNDSAINVLRELPDNSIDYIITDPPHGNRIPYLELSMMWNEWLQNDVNYEDEIVISESKDRKKDKNSYHESLNLILSQIERILKPNHYFTLMFNSLDDETWLSLIRHISTLSLELDEIETIGYSANSVVQDNRGVGLKTDFVFTFRKNTIKTVKKFVMYSCVEHKEELIKAISEYILSSDNGRETYEILNYLMMDFLKKGNLFNLSKILTIIRENFHSRKNKWFL